MKALLKSYEKGRIKFLIHAPIVPMKADDVCHLYYASPTQIQIYSKKKKELKLNFHGLRLTDVGILIIAFAICLVERFNNLEIPLKLRIIKSCWLTLALFRSLCSSLISKALSRAASAISPAALQKSPTMPSCLLLYPADAPSIAANKVHTPREVANKVHTRVAPIVRGMSTFFCASVRSCDRRSTALTTFAVSNSWFS